MVSDRFYEATVGRVTEELEREDRAYTVDVPEYSDSAVDVLWEHEEGSYRGLRFTFHGEIGEDEGLAMKGYVWTDASPEPWQDRTYETGPDEDPDLESDAWSGIETDLERFYDSWDLRDQFYKEFSSDGPLTEETVTYASCAAIEALSQLDVPVGEHLDDGDDGWV